MPSLPTSLSVVALALAWLVVLVPMAARRREHVPESDDRSAGFRVLRRSSRRRNRRVLSRTAVASADPDERNGGVDPMDDQMLWSEDEDFEGDDEVLDGDVLDGAVRADELDGEDPDEDEDESEELDDDQESADGADLAESLYDEDDDLDTDEDEDGDEDEDDQLDDLVEDGRRPQAMTVSAPAAHARTAPPDPRGQDRFAQWDAADEWTAEHPAAPAPRAAVENPPAARAGAVPRSDSGGSGDPGRTATRHDDGASDDPPAPDPTSLRPVPRRPGRGGFDPEAAAKARAFRYRRRRRVSVALLLAVVAFTLVSVFVAPTAWIGAVVSGALLVGYLAYLRRQVRIEESIRQRRTARLARARQIRPEYARAGARDSFHEPEADFAPSSAGHDDRYGPSAPMAQPAHYGAGTVVDLDDDDPAFSDLENHQPLIYRRASGE